MIQVFILPVKQWSVAHILAIEIPLKMLSSKKKKKKWLSVGCSISHRKYATNIPERESHCLVIHQMHEGYLNSARC